jgi:hypothetical protein
MGTGDQNRDFRMAGWGRWKSLVSVIVGQPTRCKLLQSDESPPLLCVPEGQLVGYGQEAYGFPAMDPTGASKNSLEAH